MRQSNNRFNLNKKKLKIKSLNSKSVEISYVGPNKPFRMLTSEEIENALKDLENVNCFQFFD